MRVQMNVRFSFIVGVVAFTAIAAGLACSGSPDAFQPITYGAQPWQPPPGWFADPYPTCATGYYVAIDSDTCKGCTGGIAYALCTGVTFTQCACGGPFWPGAECPKSLVCCPNDFPPFNWQEYTKYSGPGWAGYGVDPTARTCP